MTPPGPPDGAEVERRASMADQILEALNDLFMMAPVTTKCLLESRVPAPLELLEHPRIISKVHGDGVTVSVLGVLNSVAMRDGKVIQAIYADDGALLGFKTVLAKNLKWRTSVEDEADDTEVKVDV